MVGLEAERQMVPSLECQRLVDNTELLMVLGGDGGAI